MTLDEALEGADSFLAEVENNLSTNSIGAFAEAYFDELRYVYEFAKTIRAVPTTHDSKAEFESWEQFFEERKAADGKS